MSPTTMELTSLETTRQLAESLVTEFVPFVPQRPLVIGIDGPLGAGKTALTQMIAQVLGISETVTSPTYTYLEEYPFLYPGFKGMLYHLDAWRIEDQTVFDQLKIDEIIRPSQVVIIEWFGQIADWLEPTLEAQQARLVKVTLAEKNQHRTAQVEICEYD